MKSILGKKITKYYLIACAGYIFLLARLLYASHNAESVSRIDNIIVYSFVIALILLIVLMTFLFRRSLNTVELTEQGITESFNGNIRRSMLWDEIVEMGALYNNTFIYFSTKRTKDNTSFFNREILLFPYSTEAKEYIQKHSEVKIKPCRSSSNSEGPRL